MPNQYTFLSSVQEKIRSGIRVPDKQAETPSAEPLKGHAKLSIELELKTRVHGVQDETEAIEDIELYLYGPADIIGIDRRQIIRTEPQPNTQNFLPNYLAAIEFDRPDFPWLFTPAKAEEVHQRLRPWICLIVVRQQEGISLSSPSGRLLPVLKIDSEELLAQELPDLSESWAWAHSQVIHAQGLLDDALKKHPDLTLSRLLCPRRLEENTNYYACLVPTFEVGRKVGLKAHFTDVEKNIDTQLLEPAWDLSKSMQLPFELPVYYHWEFRTGQSGDFKELAEKLTPRTYKNIGSRKLFVGRGGVPDWVDMGIVELEGVFRPVKNLPSDTIEEVEQDWVESLKNLLHQTIETESTSEPIVGPPIYAHFHHSSEGMFDQQPNWLSDLNLNVRHRSAAGLGVFFVQKLQEELMHSAWQQLGDIQRAQQIRRQRELGKEVSQAMYQKNFEPLTHFQSNGGGFPELTDTFFYQLTAPAHALISTQIPIISAQAAQNGETNKIATYCRWSRDKQLPTGGTISTFRKLSRPKGPMARRMQAQLSLADSIGVKSAQIGKIIPKSFESALKPLGKARLELIGQYKEWEAFSETPGGEEIDAGALSRMKQAIDRLSDSLQQLGYQPPEEKWFFPVKKSFTDHLSQLNNSLNPSTTTQNNTTIPLSSTFSVQSGNGSQQTPPGRQPIPHPTFPQAMYELMLEFAPDFLLPGADRIKDNTVTILDINAEFIEAFMLGLNHEMARELLWRNYPTDQRGTYFQNFWSHETIDLKKIHLWSLQNRRLGDTLREGWQAQIEGDSQDQLALIVRGELLRRFPNTIIYAIKAKAENRGTETEPEIVTTLSSAKEDRQYPIHRGELNNDTVFLLFNLDETEARGNLDMPEEKPGWFFIIQQQPTEARFGLDVSSAGSGLAWEETGTLPGKYLSAVEIPPPLRGNEEPQPRWNFNSAHTAEILLRQPYGIGIHASNLLPNS